MGKHNSASNVADIVFNTLFRSCKAYRKGIRIRQRISHTLHADSPIFIIVPRHNAVLKLNLTYTECFHTCVHRKVGRYYQGSISVPDRKAEIAFPRQILGCHPLPQCLLRRPKIAQDKKLRSTRA